MRVRVRSPREASLRTRLRPYPHPPLRGTFSRWEKGEARAPLPPGEGLG
ncbi:hypothetical protein NB706_000138 [Xanthomonas sacchari]|nr:hypothetical protein [Xanthomonas sacchari]